MTCNPLPDAPTVHQLKCWPRYFYGVQQGYKRFELRVDDRGFRSGDMLILNEWDPVSKGYRGQRVKVRVDYILRLKDYADIKGWAWKLCRRLMPDLVVLSISPIESDSKQVNP